VYYRRNQGGGKGRHAPRKFLAHLVILCRDPNQIILLA